MGIVIKQGIKSSIISYIGIAIGTFNVLWLFPKFLDPEKIGLIRILQDIPMLLSLLVQLGTHSIIDKFFFHFENKDKKNNGFFFIILSYPLLGFSIFTLLFFGLFDYWKNFYADNSALLLNYFWYICPLTFITMYTGIMEIYLRVNMKISYTNFLREVAIRFFILVIVLLFISNLLNLDGLVLAFLIANTFVLLLLLFYIKKIGILYLSPNFEFLNRKLVKEIGSYVAFMVPGTLGAIMVQKIDNLMIGAISHNGLADVAVYSLAYFIGTVVEVPRKSITQISIPILSKATKENDIPTIDLLYKKNSLNQFLIGTVLFTCIWMNVDDLLSLIPNHEIYASGKFIILYIGLAKLTDMATSINGEIIQLTKLYKFNIIAMAFLGVITVALNLILIPAYGIKGAAIAFALSILLYNFIKTLYIWKKMKIQPFTYHFIHLTTLFTIFLILSFLQPITEHSIFMAFVFIAIKSTALLLIYFLSIRYFKISSDLNNVIDKVLEQISQKTNMGWLRKL